MLVRQLNGQGESIKFGPMKIRSVQPSDNLALAKMIRSVFIEFDAPRTGTVFADSSTDDLFGLFTKPNSKLFVLELEGEPVGCCGFFPTAGLPEGWAEVVKFYLAPSARGKGYGKVMLQRTIEEAELTGFSNLYLESIPEYATAVGLYLSMGFKALDQRMGDSGHCSCDLWFARTAAASS